MVEYIISYGMPYSGTTVFAKSLAKAVDACTLNSRAEGVWEIKSARPDDSGQLLKRRWNPQTKLIDRVLVDYWNMLASQSGKMYVVEKSPPLMFHRDALKSFIPDMREFVIVRDPIQLYLSHRKRQVVDGRRLRTKDEQLEKTTVRWTRDWCDLFLRRLERLALIVNDNVELVMYDDFVRDPESYVNGLVTLKGIAVSGMSDVVEVKGAQPEKIEVRDKVPEEWMTAVELKIIESTIFNHDLYRNLYEAPCELHA